MTIFLNRISLAMLSISGAVILFCLMGFIALSFIILLPGIALYYLSIKMGIQEAREKFYGSEQSDNDELYDENGLKIIGSSTSSDTKKPESGVISNYARKSATWLRNLLNKYID